MISTSSRPDRPAELRVGIEKFVTQGGSDLDVETLVFQFAIRLSEPQLQTPPDLRAALLEVLNQLPTEQIRLEDGSVSVVLRYSDSQLGPARQTLIFDRNGYLIEHVLIALDGAPEISLPPDTTITSIRQSSSTRPVSHPDSPRFDPWFGWEHSHVEHREPAERQRARTSSRQREAN